jgi:hypothetical protein
LRDRRGGLLFVRKLGLDIFKTLQIILRRQHKATRRQKLQTGRQDKLLTCGSPSIVSNRKALDQGCEECCYLGELAFIAGSDVLREGNEGWRVVENEAGLGAGCDRWENMSGLTIHE